MTKKRTATAAVTKPRTRTVDASKVTKTALADKIFLKMYGSKDRKDIIEKFKAPQSEGGAGLTANGANTYYQKRKSEADGVGKAKVAATA